MLSIGAFAQIGQVTHRMLRHWDAIGLLVPAHVDGFSGYRSYDPAQLDRLHRIVALRQLGFGLDDIASILADDLPVAELSGMLRLRRAEVEREYRVAAVRLVDVQRRLRLIEQEKDMSIEIIEKSLPAVRLAARTVTVAEQPEIAGVVGGMFDGVAAVIGDREGALASPLAVYDMAEDGIRVIVGYVYGGPAREGIEIVELPASPQAACAVHLGEMARIGESWQALHSALLDRGLVPNGSCRELYVRAESDDQADWVTELQQPVTSA